jgi:LysR family hca operon transcriptional activator
MNSDMGRSTALEVRHLRYFVAVAEDLSFTRAARRLETSQPSLSQQIRQLEGILGVELFDRSRHHVDLTNAGRVFLSMARDILSRVDHAVKSTHEAADGRAGELSVGTFASADVLVLPSLRRYMKTRLPEISLTLHSKYAIDPVEGLRNGTLDVSFLRGPLEVDDLEILELMTEPLVVVLPKKHALARRNSIPARRLHDVPSVTLECAHAPALHAVIDSFLRQADIQRNVAASADSVLGALQLVQDGLGFALLPESFGALIPLGVVVRPLEFDPVPLVTLAIGWKAGNSSQIVKEFVNAVCQCCADPARASIASRQHREADRGAREYTLG